MNNRPWIISQEWHDILFLHWPVSAEDIRQYIPSELELELFNNKAWISLVFFQVKENRPRLIPAMPGISSFLELNVRTYVTYKEKSGVYFLSIDANNQLITKLVNYKNFMPFRHANITLKKYENAITFYSRSKQIETNYETLIASYEPISGPIERSQLECWLSERYHCWTKIDDHLLRVDNAHTPWTLQKAAYTIHENSIASYLNYDDKENYPIAHYSKMKKVHLYPPVKET
ncbi:YqjF family protein [Viridibacillus arvi]|uniref:YqjF family protein n=1 Tax=Viridibacillus arvi TaxID=263475 RepID=UPI0036904EB1